MENKYTLDGFSFLNAADYERAKKEKETIAYLSANTDMTDMKAVYKIYKLSIEKKSFQTVFGLNYLEELRGRLVGSGTVTEEMLEPIPVAKIVVAAKQSSQGVSDKTIQKYQEECQKAKAGSMIKNFLIVVLIIVIGGMLFITSKNQYSIFTYFTNYKEEMRNEIVDELEHWETELNEREAALEKREKALEQTMSSEESIAPEGTALPEESASLEGTAE